MQLKKQLCLGQEKKENFPTEALLTSLRKAKKELKKRQIKKFSSAKDAVTHLKKL